MEDFEARRVLAAARSELGGAKPVTAKSIVAANAAIWRIGLADKDKVAVIAQAIKSQTGCDLERDTLEREIRKLPEYRETRGRAKKTARTRSSACTRRAKAAEIPINKPQVDLRNINREGWN